MDRCDYDVKFFLELPLLTSPSAFLRRMNLKFFVGRPNAVARRRFLEHPELGLPARFIATIGIEQLLMMTINFSHDNMITLMNRLVPWINKRDREMTTERVVTFFREFCDAERVLLGGFNVPDLVCSADHGTCFPPTDSIKVMHGCCSVLSSYV